MNNYEKSRELLNKHLYIHGGDSLGITDGKVYMAVIDAISEALQIQNVSSNNNTFMCAHGNENRCKEQCFTCSEDEKCDNEWINTCGL